MLFRPCLWQVEHGAMGKTEAVGVEFDKAPKYFGRGFYNQRAAPLKQSTSSLDLQG